MKYLKFLLLFFIIIGCSSDDSSSNESATGKAGSLAIFAIKANYLYSVDNAQLNVFSLIDGAHPSKVNEIYVGFNIETLFSFKEFLFIGSQNGMFIYSVANPENPVQLSSAQHFTSCDPVVANETHAFVTLHSNTNCGNDINMLQIYDIQDVRYPVLVHERNLTYPRGLGLYRNFLVVCDADIKIFDISTPAEPTLVKTINKPCFDVIIDGDTMYAIGENGLYRYHLDANDITNVTLESQVTFN